MTHCWSVVLVSFIIQMYCLKGWGYLHLNVLSKIHLDHSHLNLTVGKGKKKEKKKVKVSFSQFASQVNSNGENSLC